MASPSKKPSSIRVKDEDNEKCVPKLYEKALKLEHDLLEKEKNIIVEKESNSSNNNTNNNQQRNNNTTKQNDQQILIENQIKMIRVQLCEILNDIILYNSQFAIQHSIIDKLWKNCFYNRIIKLRTRKLKVQQKIDSQSNNNKDMTKYFKLVSQYKQILNHDLYEGIHMYLYVCKILQNKFLYAIKQHTPTQQQKTSSITTTATTTTNSTSHKKNHINNSNKNMNSIKTVYNNNSNDNNSNRYINSLVPMKLDGIIECLRRLYIHVGDCYRYTEDDNQKAKTMYTYSSRLGPGNGQSYNQLGVLCQQQHQQQEQQCKKQPRQVEQQQQQQKQQKQQRTNNSKTNESNNQLVIALFYYCRAILASHQPFTTAITNMERLFIENRQQLEQQQKEQIIIVDNPSSKNSTNNAVSVELYNFCTNFIDMHYNIYVSTKTEAIKSKNDNDQGQEQEQQHSDSMKEQNEITTTISNTAIEYSIQQTISKLEHLLNITAITDNLLCKLLTIHAFTVHDTYKKHNTSKQKINEDTATTTAAVVDEKDGDVNHFDSRSNSSMCYSLRSTFLFSECISKRVLITLTKQVKQVMVNIDQKNKNSITKTPIIFPSIRLLLPLMIITEYFFHLITTTTKQHQNNGIDNNLHHELENFWKLIVKILNLLKQISSAFRLRNIYDDDDKDNNNKNNDHFSILQEYCTLRGYKPFQSFLQDIQNDGNISDEEASTLFDNNSENNTSSISTNNNSNNNNNNNNSKVSSSNNGMISTKPTTTEQQSRCKVTRFLYLGRLIAASDEINIVFNSDNDKFIWITPAIKDATTNEVYVELNNHLPEKQKIELESKNYNEKNTSIIQEYISNDNVESLTYQHDSVGGNQLLVPGAMLQMQLPLTTSSPYASNTNDNKNVTMEAVSAATSMHHYTHLPSRNGIQIAAAANGSNDIMEQTTSLLANSMVTTAATAPPPTTTRHELVGGDTYVSPTTRSFISPPPGFGTTLPPSSSQTTTNSVIPEEGGTSFLKRSSWETNNNNPNRYPMESIDQNYPVGFMESNFQNLHSFTSDPNLYGNNYLTTTCNPSISLHHQPPAYETRNPFVEPIYHYDSYQNGMLNSTSSTTESYVTNNNQYRSVAPSWDDAVGINGNLWSNNDTGTKLIDSSLLHSIFSVDNDNNTSDRKFS